MFGGREREGYEKENQMRKKLRRGSPFRNLLSHGEIEEGKKYSLIVEMANLVLKININFSDTYNLIC